SAGGTRLAPAGSALRPPVSAPPRRPWSHRPVQARSPVQGRDRRPVDESEVDGGWARATGGAGRVQDGTGGGAAGRPVLIGIGSATQDTGPVDASEIGGPWGPAAVTAAVGAGQRGPASPRAGTAPRAGSAEGGRGPLEERAECRTVPVEAPREGPS